MIASMQCYCVWRCESYGYWAWIWAMALELRKYEIDFVHLIVVIFGIKHGYRILDVQFKYIQGDLDVYMKLDKARFSWLFIG